MFIEAMYANGDNIYFALDDPEFELDIIREFIGEFSSEPMLIIGEITQDEWESDEKYYNRYTIINTFNNTLASELLSMIYYIDPSLEEDVEAWFEVQGI